MIVDSQEQKELLIELLKAASKAVNIPAEMWGEAAKLWEAANAAAISQLAESQAEILPPQ